MPIANDRLALGVAVILTAIGVVLAIEWFHVDWRIAVPLATILPFIVALVLLFLSRSSQR